MRRFWVVTTALALLLIAVPSRADEELVPGLLELRFTPTRRAQLAIWIERADGEFLATVRLTEAVALRGIGNRPGASQMNSGFRWPYGRREGVLPIWAHRRVSTEGAEVFRRVIFQSRLSEGLASQTNPNDDTVDDYYCLSFDASRSSKEALDAVSCASQFSSDKGRFITENDVARGYAEPYEVPETGQALMRPLSLDSLYPPRRDLSPCNAATAGCSDHGDVAQFDAHAREVMPEIDVVTMATPVGGVAQEILFPLPRDWPPGDYRACIEINVEGDYNDTFNDRTFPTPAKTPECTAQSGWDHWAVCFGYPYRGQPSVVYCADFKIGGAAEQTFSTSTPVGSAGTWDDEDPRYGELFPMDGMTDDPVNAPGSGADRLAQQESDGRLLVTIKAPQSCMQNQPPTGVTRVEVSRHENQQHAHEWARLLFSAADDDAGIFRYEVRVSQREITDDASFMAAMPAKEASVEAAELLVPTGAEAGEAVGVEMGGLVASTHYYIGVRAIDGCASVGPISTAEFTTPERVFATVTPCFVATAAFGTPLAAEVGSLRRFRDRYLLSHAPGRALVGAYYGLGPALSAKLAQAPTLRAAARSVLRPAITAARWLEAR